MSEEIHQNMRIWDRVSSTPPSVTKEANNGRFTFTCIDPCYQRELATRLWGPYGDTWGLEHLEFTMIENEIHPAMMLRCSFYYPNGDPSRTPAMFPIAVDIKFKPGEDCCKKLMTSAVSKALSYLGFAADVFAGKFDDDQYVQMQSVKYEKQDAFVTTAKGRIMLATTKERLRELNAKTVEMVADEIITRDIGQELIELIESRLAEVG